MGRTTLFLGFLLLGCFGLKAQDTVLIWRDTLRSNWLLRPQSYPMLRADTTGAYLMAGFQDTLYTSFDPPRVSKGLHDGILIKYDELGNIAWRYTIESKGNMMLGHIKRFPSGNLACIGFADDTCKITDQRVWGRGGFALMISRRGNLRYLMSKTLRNHVFPDIDARQNFCIAQSYSDSVWVDSTHVYYDKSKYPNSLLAVYSARDQLSWHTLLDTIPDFYRTGALYAHGVAAGRDGSLFVSGFFQGTPFLNKDHLRGFYERDLFLASYSAQGNHLWTTQLSSSPRDFFLYKMYYRYDQNRLIVEARSRERGTGQPDLHHRYSILSTGTNVTQELYVLPEGNPEYPREAVRDMIPVADGSFYQMQLIGDLLILERFEISFTSTQEKVNLIDH